MVDSSAAESAAELAAARNLLQDRILLVSVLLQVVHLLYLLLLLLPLCPRLHSDLVLDLIPLILRPFQMPFMQFMLILRLLLLL